MSGAKAQIGLLALSITLLGMGCSGPAKEETFTAHPPDPALEGRFFATAGENESLADLYEVQFTPFRLYRQTHNQRVGAIGSCPSTLVAADADQTVGFTDTLRRFDAGTFSVIEGLNDPKGSLPTLAPDCRLVFNQFDRSTKIDHLVIWDPNARTTRELFSPGVSDKTLGVSDWGPGGRVAVFEGTAPTEGHPTVSTALVVISPDGSRRTIDPPVAQFGTLQWGASGWMAMADEGRGTVFLNPDTGQRSELAGWVPLAWSPDGQRLLVAEAKERKKIGLVDAGNLGAVRTVGSAKKVALFDLVWLPAGATAGGPVTIGRRPDDGDL